MDKLKKMLFVFCEWDGGRCQLLFNTTLTWKFIPECLKNTLKPQLFSFKLTGSDESFR